MPRMTGKDAHARRWAPAVGRQAEDHRHGQPRRLQCHHMNLDRHPVNPLTRDNAIPETLPDRARLARRLSHRPLLKPEPFRKLANDVGPEPPEGGLIHRKIRVLVSSRFPMMIEEHFNRWFEMALQRRRQWIGGNDGAGHDEKEQTQHSLHDDSSCIPPLVGRPRNRVNSKTSPSWRRPHTSRAIPLGLA